MCKKNEANENAEILFQAFNDLEESSYKNSRGEIIEPQSKVKNKTFSWRKIGVIAASLVIIIGSITLLKNNLPGGNSSQGIGSPNNVSVDESNLFMRYEGPVLPIMISPENKNPDINVERKLIYDFYRLNDMEPTAGTVLLKDQYQIKNNGEEGQIKVLYPFVSSIDDMYYSYPRIMQDGKVLEPKLYYGNYTGDFVSTKDEIDPLETLNLKDYVSWQEFQTVLKGRSYLDAGYASPPDIKDITVTVYSFSNSYYSETSEVENPTLVAGIEIDRNKSTVLTLGFEGFAKLDDSKEEYYQYSIPKKNEYIFAEGTRYLIIVGEDSPSINIETQSTGGWDAYEKKSSHLRNNLEDAGADLERNEMSLDEALELTLPILYERYKENQLARENDFSYWKLDNHKISSYVLSYEEFKGLYIKELFETGVLNEKPMMRYEDGSLDLIDVTNIQRIIFAEFDLDLTRSKTTELNISSYKQGSYDFIGEKYDQKIYGYDLLTTLDLAIPIDIFEVEIIDYDKVVIVKQNFSFDLEKDIRLVTLSKDIPHYFMEVTEKK